MRKEQPTSYPCRIIHNTTHISWFIVKIFLCYTQTCLFVSAEKKSEMEILRRIKIKLSFQWRGKKIVREFLKEKINVLRFSLLLVRTCDGAMVGRCWRLVNQSPKKKKSKEKNPLEEKKGNCFTRLRKKKEKKRAPLTHAAQYDSRAQCRNMARGARSIERKWCH